MKKNTRKRFLGSLITVALIATLLPGCGQKKEVSAAASEIKYSSKGEYTTTLKVEGTDVKGLSAEDVKVTYQFFDAEGYDKALTAASGAALSQDEVKKYLYEKEAEVSSVTVKSDSELDISFTDKDAALKTTMAYSIKAEKKNITADALVSYEKGKITTNIEYVLATAKEVRLTLTLEEGSFTEGITKEDIALAGSFENMNIESLSSAGKNLTMQLTGDITMNEDAGTYLNGVITLAEKTIFDAKGSCDVTIPILEKAALFDAKNINVNGSTVTIPLTLIDITDLDKLTKEQISFEGDVKVTGVTKKSNTQVELSLEIPGVTDKNSAAKALDGGKVKVGTYEFSAGTSAASFYPVFDYVEKEGDNLKFTLKLYASNGTFAENINEKNVSFGDDFKDGKIVSFKKETDTTAELVLTAPANGQTDEDLNLTGQVILAKGSLVSTWGDATSEEVSYVRKYTKDSMGKDFSANDIDTIKNIVGGFGNTTFGTIAGICSGAGTAYSVVMTVLETTGVVDSDHVKVMKKLESISDEVKKIHSVTDDTNKVLKEMRLENYDKQLKAFDTKLANFVSLTAHLENVLAKAKKKLSSEDIPKTEKPSTSLSPNSPEWVNYNKEWAAYLEKLLKVISDNPNDMDFGSFSSDVKDLRTKFIDIANILSVNSGTGSDNPIKVFDAVCPYICNFSSSAAVDRRLYRANIIMQLRRGLSALMACYNYTSEDRDSTIYREIIPKCNEAVNAIESLKVESPAKRYCYPWNLEIEGLDTNWTSLLITNGKKDKMLSADQIDEFIRRMNGRTLRQELTKAGITIPNDSDYPKEGVYFGLFDRGEESSSFLAVFTGIAFLERKYSEESDGYCYITGKVINETVKTKVKPAYDKYGGIISILKWDDKKLTTCDFSDNSKIRFVGYDYSTYIHKTNLCSFKTYTK